MISPHRSESTTVLAVTKKKKKKTLQSMYVVRLRGRKKLMSSSYLNLNDYLLVLANSCSPATRCPPQVCFRPPLRHFLICRSDSAMRSSSTAMLTTNRSTSVHSSPLFSFPVGFKCLNLCPTNLAVKGLPVLRKLYIFQPCDKRTLARRIQGKGFAVQFPELTLCLQVPFHPRCLPGNS